MTIVRKILAIGLMFFVLGAVTMVVSSHTQPPSLLAGDDPKLPTGG